jgi:uncharacterized membrane protein YedE/YeeE
MCTSSLLHAGFLPSVCPRRSQYSFIRDQMLMRRFLMLKMFLSAASVSVAVLTILPIVSRRARASAKLLAEGASVRLAEKRGLPAVAIGAALIGVGMAISGSCPGTVFAQLASGSVQARYILAGGLFAASINAWLDSDASFTSALKRGRVQAQSFTIDALIGSRRLFVAVPLVVMLASLVAGLEYAAPWRSELATLLPAAAVAGPGVIPPPVAGMVVGLLQLPLVYFLGSQLGCSGSYMTMIANIVGFAAPEVCAKSPVLEANKRSYFQLKLMAGVMLGAFTASYLSGAAFMSDALISRPEALLGGFLLVMGARLAAGCTSGHGISGMGHLAVNSFVAVPAMFGAGIATAFMIYN